MGRRRGGTKFQERRALAIANGAVQKPRGHSVPCRALVLYKNSIVNTRPEPLAIEYPVVVSCISLATREPNQRPIAVLAPFYHSPDTVISPLGVPVLINRSATDDQHSEATTELAEPIPEQLAIELVTLD